MYIYFRNCDLLILYSRSWTSESEIMLFDADLATLTTFVGYFSGILSDYLHALWILLVSFL